jgi:hypothetical protein
MARKSANLSEVTVQSPHCDAALSGSTLYRTLANDSSDGLISAKFGKRALMIGINVKQFETF